jgi:probable HAF family extracellular repeat protein
VEHGFLRDSLGVFTTLDPSLSTTVTEASGINNSGQIVGVFGIDPLAVNGHLDGFLRDSLGVYSTLVAPGSIFTEARGINDAGVIVGRYDDAGGVEHGFLWDSLGLGVFTTFDPVGSTFTAALGINDAGVIVGTFIDSTGQHGFLRDNLGVFTTLDPSVTAIYGINDASQLVGQFNDVIGGSHAFLATQAIPEPETYAMLLAGLGLTGFFARRRKQRAA